MVATYPKTNGIDTHTKALILLGDFQTSILRNLGCNFKSPASLILNSLWDLRSCRSFRDSYLNFDLAVAATVVAFWKTSFFSWLHFQCSKQLFAKKLWQPFKSYCWYNLWCLKLPPSPPNDLHILIWWFIHSSLNSTLLTQRNCDYKWSKLTLTPNIP